MASLMNRSNDVGQLARAANPRTPSHELLRMAARACATIKHARTMHPCGGLVSVPCHLVLAAVLANPSLRMADLERVSQALFHVTDHYWSVGDPPSGVTGLHPLLARALLSNPILALWAMQNPLWPRQAGDTTLRMLIDSPDYTAVHTAQLARCIEAERQPDYSTLRYMLHHTLTQLGGLEHASSTLQALGLPAAKRSS